MRPYTALVRVLDSLLDKLPKTLVDAMRRHHELLKFAVVGGTTFVIDTAIFLVLKSTVLEAKPVTAKVIGTTVATVVSYVLNREWSFRTRGGRANHHEAMLFFLISAIGVVVTSVPLWVSRYGLHLETPQVSRVTQEVADLVSAQVIGTLLAMAFRWWAFRRFVFPHEDARPRGAEPSAEDARALDEVDLGAAELLGDPWPAIDGIDTERSRDLLCTERSRDLLDADTEDPLSARS
jgi:putative flippase GtrA